jgi:hypothetical protein
MFRSSDSNTLSIHSRTGASLALRPGQAYVKHTGIHGIVHRSRVYVHRVGSITMNTSNVDFLVPSESYVFPICVRKAHFGRYYFYTFDL